MNQATRYGSAGWTTGVPPVMTLQTETPIPAPAMEAPPMETQVPGMTAPQGAPAPNMESSMAAAPAPIPEETPVMDAALRPEAPAMGSAVNPPRAAVPAQGAGSAQSGTLPMAAMVSDPPPAMNECETPVMAFFDFQPWGEPYEVEIGFERGTIFPALDLPWLVGGGEII